MITYGFFNSISGDRKYNASQMSALFDGIIKDGVFMSIGDTLIVSTSLGMNISVKTGRAWFNRTWTNNDSELPLTLDAAELVLDRIDIVALEINSNEDVRANSIKIIKGTPSSVPVAPALTRTDLVNQYPLCQVYIAAGVTEITAANITNTVGTAACPFVTGILQTVNIDTLLAQWDGEFTTWFDGIKNTLDGDTAGNLLNLIQQRVPIGATWGDLKGTV